jgi:glycosyltransferase involved in cell wall biosynthesis
VSLVVGTLGTRSSPLVTLLDSLRAGTHQNIELILVDQSDDSLLARTIAPYRDLSIVHVTSAPGLSRARNVGMAHVTGDIIGFPDDDCWYPKTLLSSVVERFRTSHSLGGLAVRPVDADGHSSFPRWDPHSGHINRFNVWRRSNSNALFLRKSVVDVVGPFDENLGVGSGTPWGAAEDIDYPLRILEAGFPLYYDSTLTVHHPRSTPRFDAAGASRAESYGGGMGRVLRKHAYPWWFVLYQGARPLGGALLSAASGRWGKARYHLAILRGRRRGWLSGRDI